MSDLRDGIVDAKSPGVRLDQGNARPLVTFYLVTYNHEQFVRQAIESALAQTYRPIQFIFTDDCSTDRTFEIMREMVASNEGNENILLNRNEKNLGTVDHLNKVFLKLAKGKYFIPLAGDDITSPDRTEKVVSLFEATGASAVAVNPVMLDEDGQSSGARLFASFPSGVLHFEEYFVKGVPFFGGGGYARELFDVYGPMKNSARNEDRILPCRASTLSGIAYLNKPVYFYREHGKNMSFWVKIKRDPLNSTHYETASRKNELQNLANFMQEVRESYQGQDKNEIVAQISARFKRQQFELTLLGSGISSRIARIIAAYRKGENFKGKLALLLICISPRVYRFVLAVRQAIR